MRNDFLYGPGPVIDQNPVSGLECTDLFRIVMILQIQNSNEVSAVTDPVCAPEGEPEFAVALVETVMINRDGTDFRGTGTGDEAEREQQDQQDCGQDLIAFHGDSSLRVGGDGFQCFHSV